jgi:hypothetical protein
MKFVSIKNFDKKEMRVILREIPNIERIDCNDFQYFFGQNEIYNSKLEDMRLKGIESLNNFYLFVDKYDRRIKKLFIDWKESFNSEDINETLKQISRFKNIKALKLDISIEIASVYKSLILIGVLALS